MMEFALRASAVVQILRIGTKDELEFKVFKAVQDLPLLGMVYAEVTTITDKARPAELQAEELIKRIIKIFKNQVCTMHA